jgi:hypothetical protein
MGRVFSISDANKENHANAASKEPLQMAASLTSRCVKDRAMGPTVI